MTFKTSVCIKSTLHHGPISPEFRSWAAANDRNYSVSPKLFFLCLMVFVCTFLYLIFILYGATLVHSSEFPSVTKNPQQYNYDGILKNALNAIYVAESSCPKSRIEQGSFSPFKEYRIVCYYVIQSNSTHSRKLPPSYVDPYLCTHIIVGFAGVSNGTIYPGPEDVLEVYKTITAFKNMNPSLKVLLSVEEFSSNGEFARMVSEEKLRTRFSAHVIQFLEKYAFDGIDLDWEFPAWPSPDEEQRANFSLLLQEVKKQILIHDNKTYILSVAVGAPQAIIDQSYHIADLARYADFINLMSYDYHMFTEYLPLTGPNSPLFPRPLDTGFWSTMNVNWSATHWNLCGMPLEKINIGIPTYGHSYTLVNGDNNGWNAPAKGFGSIGTQGFTSYPDACHFVSNPQTTQVFDENYLVPYLYRGKEWISYENTLSVEYKAKFIKENRFGGAMIYSLNSDDFYGECGTIKFPLLRQVTNILSSS